MDFYLQGHIKGKVYGKITKAWQPQELNLSSFLRRDDRKCVSKREELGEETEMTQIHLLDQEVFKF